MQGVYVHIPFCKARCKYCAFVSCTDFGLMRGYIDALKNEIVKRADNVPADTVYIGGGTPSTLFKGGLTEVIEAVKQNFNIVKNAEITVEANPDSLSDEFIHECISCGVNRLSVGLQSCDDECLAFAGRIHSFNQFLSGIERAKKAGIKNLSCDVMLGLKGQSLKSVKDTLQIVTDMEFPHVSVYALKTEEGTPFYNESYFPDEDGQADMYEASYLHLKSCGYNRYEVSNFCKKGYESRHNSKYWNLTDYIGLGLSAHSLKNEIRSENTEDFNEYLQGKFIKSSQLIGREERVFEFVMLSLRTQKGLDLKLFRQLFGYCFYSKNEKKIRMLQSKNLLEKADNRLFLTENAFFVMNSVICELI